MSCLALCVAVYQSQCAFSIYEMDECGTISVTLCQTVIFLLSHLFTDRAPNPNTVNKGQYQTTVHKEMRER